jgi:hypothetical protein
MNNVCVGICFVHVCGVCVYPQHRVYGNEDCMLIEGVCVRMVLVLGDGMNVVLQSLLVYSIDY